MPLFVAKSPAPPAVLLTASLCMIPIASVALPPPDDIPEEILRTEVVTRARSPIDGKPLTAAEYAELQEALATAPPGEPTVSPKLKKVINLLKLRKFIQTIFPFVNIKCGSRCKPKPAKAPSSSTDRDRPSEQPLNPKDTAPQPSTP